MAFGARSFGGGSLQTTLSADMTNSQTTASLSNSPASLGWIETYGANVGSPLGTSGSFLVVLDKGQSTEEKVLASAISSSTITGLTRAADGGTAYAHAAANAYIVAPIGGAIDFYEANQAVLNTIGKIAAAGDLLQGSGANTLAKLAASSTTGAVLRSNGAGMALSWDTTYAPSLDSGWSGLPSLLNSWGDVGAPLASTGYRVQGNWVHLRGAIVGGASGAEAFLLPLGYRPATDLVLTAACANGGTRDTCLLSVYGVTSTVGEVIPNFTTAGSTVYLDGLRFPKD